MNVERIQKNLNLLIEKQPDLRDKFNISDLQKTKKNFQLFEENGEYRLEQDAQLVDILPEDDSPLKFDEQKNIKIAVLIGFGLGSQLKKLLEKLPEDPNRHFIIIEPDMERFLYAISKTDFEESFPLERTHWWVGDSKDVVFAKTRSFYSDLPYSCWVESTQIFRHSLLDAFHKKTLDAFEDEVQASIKQFYTACGYREDSLLGVQRIVENKERIETLPGIWKLRHEFPGSKAVVVGAGPSLKKSLDELKEIQHKALIISSDTAAKPLIRHGIHPHFILSLERVEETVPFIENIDYLDQNFRSHLLAYPLAHPRLFEEFPGKKWMCYRNLNLMMALEHFLPKGLIASSSSVTHFCTRFACFLGAEEIYLIGQDLCYDPKSLQSHSAGTAYEKTSNTKTITELNQELQAKGRGQVFFVEGNDGSKVPTNSIWFNMAKEFSWEATELPSLLINATEGGAKIPNIEWKSLGEEAKNWKPLYRDVFEVLNEKHQESALNYQNEIPWGQFHSIVDSYQNRLHQLLNQVKLLRQKELSEKETQKILQVFRKSCDALLQEGYFQLFIWGVAGREFFRLENEYQSLSKPEKNGLQVLESWFEEALFSAQRVTELLDRTIDGKSDTLQQKKGMNL